jgi:hypothetical protein
MLALLGCHDGHALKTLDLHTGSYVAASGLDNLEIVRISSLLLQNSRLQRLRLESNHESWKPFLESLFVSTRLKEIIFSNSITGRIASTWCPSCPRGSLSLSSLEFIMCSFTGDLFLPIKDAILARSSLMELKFENCEFVFGATALFQNMCRSLPTHIALDFDGTKSFEIPDADVLENILGPTSALSGLTLRYFSSDTSIIPAYLFTTKLKHLNLASVNEEDLQALFTHLPNVKGLETLSVKYIYISTAFLDAIQRNTSLLKVECWGDSGNKCLADSDRARLEAITDRNAQFPPYLAALAANGITVPPDVLMAAQTSENIDTALYILVRATGGNIIEQLLH